MLILYKSRFDMATKKLFILFFVFVFIFIVLFTLFGHSGLLVNRSLQQRLEVQALEQQRMQVQEEDYFDDVALSLGYNRYGDVVYYFQEPDVIESPAPSAARTEQPVEIYEGADAWLLALISLALTAFSAFLVFLIRHFAGRRTEHAHKDGPVSRYENFDWS